MLKLRLRRTLREHCGAFRGWAHREQKDAVWAGVAQLVEHLICNQRVGGSNPFVSSSSIQQQYRKTDWVVLLAAPACRPPVTPSKAPPLRFHYEYGMDVDGLA